MNDKLHTTELKDLSDEHLLKLFASDNINAYKILTIRYKDDLISFLHKYTNGYSYCADIVQEAFIILFEYQNKVHTIKEFKPWIYRVAINEAKKQFSNDSKLPVVSLEEYEDVEYDLDKNSREEFIEEIPDFDTPETPLEILQKCLDRLDGKFKSAVLLRYDEDLDYESIAKILKIPVGTVRSRINHGREQLKKLIAEEMKIRNISDENFNTGINDTGKKDKKKKIKENTDKKNENDENDEDNTGSHTGSNSKVDRDDEDPDDILNNIKLLPRQHVDDDEFLDELFRKIAERRVHKKSILDSIIGFIREHIFISAIGLTAMIAILYFSYDYFSDDRIELSGQSFNNVIVDLTQYRNLKLVPSLPDTLMRSVVGSVQGKSVLERVKVLGIEKVPAGMARERIRP